jgi:hypothetical protein
MVVVGTPAVLGTWHRPRANRARHLRSKYTLFVGALTSSPDRPPPLHFRDGDDGRLAPQRAALAAARSGRPRVMLPQLTLRASFAACGLAGDS